MQVPIVNGVYVDPVGDFRTSYPRNLVPVPKETGISKGHLKPAEGIAAFGTGQGADRGGIQWNGVCYRVSGTKLIRVNADGSTAVLGDVGPGDQAALDYSFDMLGVASGGRLYFWDGSSLRQVTDPDLGYVRHVCWIAGYWLCTDGTSLIVTDLNDPFSVNPLKYGSAESDPDPIMAVDKLRNEAYAFGRHTIEVFQNIGGTGFPFQRIEGGQVPKGIIGPSASVSIGNTFAFVGSGRGEAPSVYLMVPGDTQSISTREIDTILLEYTEDELAGIVMECRVTKQHQEVFVHLPDRTLVYDIAASKVVGEPIWRTWDSGVASPATLRARGVVWCYGKWVVGDPTSSAIGVLDESIGEHFGQTVGWDFGTLVLYNEGNGAIVHELELVALTGRVKAGADPVVWTSYTLDGETWSQERPVQAGRQGERLKRLAWRKQGKLRNYRMQRFRGTSDAHISFARLEVQVEALAG